MPAPLRLEVFEAQAAPDAPAALMPQDLEDLRLTAFERGYVAGWEDAVRQAEAEHGQREAAVAARIEALNFGYHEARAHVLAALEPLLAAMVAQILPVVARASVIPLVVEEVLTRARSEAARPLLLRLPPGQRAEYEVALAGLTLPPLTLIETPDLAPDQAEIAADCAETRIDLSAAQTRIAEALAAFRPLPLSETRHA